MASHTPHLEEKKDGSSTTKSYTLGKGHELRVEVSGDKEVTIKLRNGLAEIFGTEMLKDHVYSFTSVKVGVFTWHGCTLEVVGSPDVAYVAEETPMTSYINAHTGLENLRKAAAAKNDALGGPRAMLVGSTDVGKSTLCRILLNYAVRAGWKPTYVDLDVGQNDISIPGTVSATPIDFPTGMEDFSASALTAPVTYFFGHVTPSKSIHLYKTCVEQLAKSLEKRIEKNEDARKGGVIINTCGWIQDEGYDLLIHAALTLQVDVILVVGMERLHGQLKEDKRLSHITFGKLAKSEGVVVRDANYRRTARQRNIKHYFYGPPKQSLCPHKKTMSMKDLFIYRVGGGPAAPLHTLPIGAVPKVNPNQVSMVEIKKEHINEICAVSFAKDPKSLLESNVAGFVHIVNVDERTRTVTLLVPSPGPLPGKFLLMGSQKWFDL